jgi:hypothetical protein
VIAYAIALQYSYNFSMFFKTNNILASDQTRYLRMVIRTIIAMICIVFTHFIFAEEIGEGALTGVSVCVGLLIGTLHCLRLSKNVGLMPVQLGSKTGGAVMVFMHNGPPRFLHSRYVLLSDDLIIEQSGLIVLLGLVHETTMPILLESRQ